MANLSLNFIAIKATDSEMTKFLLAGTGKKKATANNAEEALQLLLSTKHKRKADDWREADSVYLSDFAETDNDAQMSYMRIVPSAYDDYLFLLFECSTRWSDPEDWVYDAVEIANIAVDWYSSDEFGEWRKIDGDYFEGALIDVDGKNAIENSIDNTSRIAVEGDIFFCDIINGREHQYCENVEDHDLSEEEVKSSLSEAEEDEAQDAYCKAKEYYYNDKEADALEYFQKAAEIGLPDAMNVMGQIYDGGLDTVEKDEKKAFEWYSKAAACGVADAQCELATFYMFDKVSVCEKNMATAIQWLKAAALRIFLNSPSSRAHYWLGMIYYVGAGVEKNLRLAFSHFRNAYELGCGDAIPMLYRCYTRGEGISVNNAKAQELKEQAEEAGLSVDEIQLTIDGYEIE